MSQQPGGPQGPNYGQNNFQQNNNQPPQDGYAPSAYSAPQPGYGQQQPYGQQPGGFGQQSGGFGALFSTSFATRATPTLVKNIMLLALVAFGIFAGYALFDLLTIITADYGPGAMGIITEIIHFAYRIAIGMVLLGLVRVFLEHVNKEDKKAE